MATVYARGLASCFVVLIKYRASLVIDFAPGAVQNATIYRNAGFYYFFFSRLNGEKFFFFVRVRNVTVLMRTQHVIISGVINGTEREA